MTITKEEIKNLADLARIEVTEPDLVKMTGEIDSILGYVGAVQQFSGGMEREIPNHRNILRDDEVTNKEGEYTEKILKNAPERDGDYLVVKKIL